MLRGAETTSEVGDGTAMNHFFLEDTARQYADRPAVISGHGTTPYADFVQMVQAMAAHLSAQNIESGDRIGIVASTSLHTLAGVMALLRLGAVVVPISTRFPAGQVAHLLSRVLCRAVLVPAEHSHLLSETQLPFLLTEILNSTAYQRNELPPWHGSLNTDATIVFTSGSTGTPKAALHTLGAHVYNALGSQQNIPIGTNDCWLVSLPLFHVGGFAVPIRTFLAGASVALPAPGTPLVDALRQFPITHLSLVATQLYRMLRDEESTELLRGLKAILLGGSAIPRTLIERALGAGLRIYTSYGCTEMASQITTTREITVGELATSGRLLPYRELMIDTTGEIFVRGKTLFRGYAEGDTVRSAVDEQGWYHTHDTGFLDSAGRLHITGRIDNMFISGGENIQPEEIEQALCSIPGILQSLVVPVDEEEFGARPVAFLWLADGVIINEAHVREQLAVRIARYKLPVRFFVEPPLEENAGKLNREEYRERASGDRISQK